MAITKLNPSQFKSGILSQDLDIRLQDTSSYFAINYADGTNALYIQDSTVDSTSIGSKDGNQLIAISDVGTDIWTDNGAGGTRKAFTLLNGAIRMNDADASHYLDLKAPATITTSFTLTLPDNDGASGQYLKTDGSGNLSWDTPAGGSTDHGALTGLADDDHTQYTLLAGRSGGQTIYGGTGAGQSLILYSTSNATKGNILLNPEGGDVFIGGGATASTLRMYDDSGGTGQWVGIKAPSNVPANYTLTLPTDDGTPDQVLKTDGSGNLSWTTVSSGSSSGIAGAIQYSDGSGGFSSEEANLFYNSTSNQLQLAGGTSYNMSIVNDNGGIELSPSSSPKTGAFNAINATANATGNVNINITNTNTGADANSRILITTASAGGDPFVGLSVGDITYIVGVDNSDSNKLKIGLGTDPSDLTSNPITITGNLVGVGGQTSPTAALHLPAGTATANTAPLKFTTGTALTTPEDGALEYHGSHLYFTIGSTRYQLDQQGGGGTPILQDGNSLGTGMVIGTNDLNSLSFETNATQRITISSSGEIDLGKALSSRILLRTSATSSSGGVEIQSTSQTATTDVAVKVTGPDYTLANANNKVMQITNSYTRSSGAVGGVTSLAINPTININTSATVSATGLEISPTITNLTGGFYGIYMNFNHANAYGIYQSGSSTKNIVNGKLSVGHTTDPAEVLDIVGNQKITGNIDVTGQYRSASYQITDGAGFNVNWNNSNVQYVTIQANRSPTFSNPKEGARYILIVIQGTGGSKTITWPTVKWRGGTAPTLTTTAGKADIITFVYANGSYYGDASLNY